MNEMNIKHELISKQINVRIQKVAVERFMLNAFVFRTRCVQIMMKSSIVLLWIWKVLALAIKNSVIRMVKNEFFWACGTHSWTGKLLPKGDFSLKFCEKIFFFFSEICSDQLSLKICLVISVSEDDTCSSKCFVYN